MLVGEGRDRRSSAGKLKMLNAGSKNVEGACRRLTFYTLATLAAAIVTVPMVAVDQDRSSLSRHERGRLIGRPGAKFKLPCRSRGTEWGAV